MTGSHAVLVLAAGGSKRLGQPKQLLARQGETLVHRMVRLALETAPSQALVVVGANEDAVMASIADLACSHVANHDWQSGLAGSLQAASTALAPGVEVVLVMACDQPAIESRHLQALLLGARSSASGCAATWHGEALGIPAVVPRSWFEHVESAPDRGFGSRLRQLPADAVHGMHAVELNLDIDSPEDLARARESGWVDGG